MQLTSLFWVLAGSAVHAAAGPPPVESYPDHYTEHYDEHRTYSDHHGDHHHSISHSDHRTYSDHHGDHHTYHSDHHGDHHHTISHSDHHGDHHGGYTRSHGDEHHHNATTVTSIVTALTTYCPSPTTLTHGTRTYTVTKATTLTILDCPCTVTEVIPVKPTQCVGHECPCHGEHCPPPPPPPCKGPDCPCTGDHCHPPPPVGTITHQPTQPPPTKPISPPIVTAAAGRVQEGVAGLAIALGAVALAAL